MYRIFISYRRSDAESFAGRVCDRLRKDFGQRRVFMDTTGLSGGIPFGDAIEKNLKTCDVVVAIIGKTWLSCADEAGQRRLDSDEDWVRKELAQALANKDALVIPVLCGGATMPAKGSLPADLVQLVQRNAIVINDGDFDSDVMKLIAACETRVSRPRRWPWFAGAAALLLAVFSGIYYHNTHEFLGVYLVPGPGFAGSLPVTEIPGRKKRYYLSFAIDGTRVGIQDLMKRSIFIAAGSNVEAPKDAQHVADLKAEIARQFSKTVHDADSIAATLSSDPIVFPRMKVRPGAKINAEIGTVEADADGGIKRVLKARCDFTIPAAPDTPTLNLYIARSSPDCREPG
ncbi:MAG TPA: toll/interleukin-1 receptor domain-containing protein [Steroidobacteraceae bacterium]|nr:toll/interleukin-1 receptor domain-containing protein [Steroidobacteraceae bacterium]